MEWETDGRIGEKEYVHNTTSILKINFQVIERGIVTIINSGQIILTEKMDKIQIGHIETTWSIGMSADKVGDCFFGMREIAQGFSHMLGVVIALPVDQVFKPASLLLGIDNVL